MSIGCQLDVNWMSIGCQLDVNWMPTSTLLDFLFSQSLLRGLAVLLKGRLGLAQNARRHPQERSRAAWRRSSDMHVARRVSA